MDLVTGALAVAAVLLIISGPRKIADPSATVELLTDLGLALPTAASRRRWIARAVGVIEVIAGVWALASHGWLPAALIGVIYVIFGVLIGIALRRGLDSCACFGRAGTPPSWFHAAIDLALAAAAFVAITADSPVEVMDRSPAGGAWFVLAVGVAAGLTYTLLDTMPRRSASGGGAQRA